MSRRNSSLGFFGLFGRSEDLRLLDKSLHAVDLHPAVVPEGVKLTIVNMMKDAWPGSEPPDHAFLPVAGLFAYCVMGQDAFLSANGPERLADVEARMENSLNGDETLDAGLVLLALHSRLINSDIIERYGLHIDEE